MYGRLDLGVNASGPICYTDIWLNPSGSRNLDPKLTFPDLESYNRYMVEHGGKPVQLQPVPPKP